MPHMKRNDSAALLPSGFVDLLPPEAEREFAAITQLMKSFDSLGYARVKPPLLEFEESLFSFGPGASLVQDTFRVMDPLSHRMMGIRSDITAQIARIACSRLQSEPRPLRLTYANDALRTKGSQHRTERQFCQVGCEIVGPDDLQKDIESCVVALIGLHELGIDNITIDLAFPQLILQIFEQESITGEIREQIIASLRRRNIAALTLNEKVMGLFSGLMDAAGPWQKSLSRMQKLALPAAAAKTLEKLQSIAEGLERAINDMGIAPLAVTIDPSETRGFHYKTGFGFTLYARRASGALGRGGRYTISFGGITESATGFTLYMDTLTRLMPPQEKQNLVYVPDSESWQVVRDLRAQGHKIIKGAGPERAQATQEYKNGKVQRI